MDEVIHGYRLLQPFTTTGGGQCRWTFAEKGDNEYFLKEFLRPTYPMNKRGSEETQRKKIADCESFEKHHRDIMHMLRRVSSAHGNLVVASDFFRSGARYYKVTTKVDVSAATPSEVSRLPTQDLWILCTALAHSINVLHGVDIVHGDLKPANVLVKETARGIPTAKLIDFDDAYRSGSPPSPAELVGDFIYYSPEVYSYMTKGSDSHKIGSSLGTRSDMFSMGIIFCEYMTGQRPVGIGPDGMPTDTCAEALNLGGKVRIPDISSDRSAIQDLLKRLLSSAPSDRPSAQEVVAELKLLRLGKPASASPRERSSGESRIGTVEIKGSLSKPRSSPRASDSSIVIRGKMIPKRPEAK
ncbi:protein kinase domain-containing protein [Mycolicibacterium cosmeticum]|uniref:protein kinase domain-containing protein n=1 Tax=Mycolicibacterium cosmeticum TaxID=258533 RepID=UPI003204E518